jgi:hypothetical protein
MCKKLATATAAPVVDPEIIRHYRAHDYYDPASSRDRAARLRERVAAAFPDAMLGRWHDAPDNASSPDRCASATNSSARSRATSVLPPELVQSHNPQIALNSVWSSTNVLAIS